MSENCLNLSTIVELAAGNSEKGVQYYRKMKENAEDPIAREIFHRLAEEEEEERRALLKVAQIEATKGQINLDEKTYCYLCALGDELNFPHDDTKIFTAINPREAFEIGIEAKKDGILLYHEFLQRCVSNEAKNILLHLIESEQMHLLELRDTMYEICPDGCKYYHKNGNTVARG
ncbi:ferritin family protein [Desulforamulus aeronauticus]|uniref:Rubrerythrin n=1 Tax=Desulforamulus aeronauticus DSM 10349 TaxID=1121421 RepID=A0A1M6WLI5_9FIRM|nr:ferritin family protein [Desulforamulus aeronauticus]SHK94541.1 Rubrerythrin [Desulforamulus aeronauticus DSM 10349]